MRKIQLIAAILCVSSSTLAYQDQLLQAVDKGDAALVTILIDEYGLNVDHSEGGTTALDIAKKRGFYHIESLLIMRGAKRRVAALATNQLQ